MLWGMSFIFIQLSTEDFGPTSAMFLRVLFGFLCLIPFVPWYEAKRIPTKSIAIILIAGILNSALPFTLLAFASQYTASGILSITNASTVFLTMLIASLWIKEAVTRWQLLGSVMGIVGLVLLFKDSLSFAQQQSHIGILLSIAACTSYAIAITLTRKYLTHIKARLLGGVSLLGATFALLPFALLNWPVHELTIQKFFSPVIIGVFCTGIAYIIYFNLIANVGAAKTAVVTMIVPFFGVLMGILILNERLTMHTVFGGLLIITGALFVMQLNRQRI